MFYTILSPLPPTLPTANSMLAATQYVSRMHVYTVSNLHVIIVSSDVDVDVVQGHSPQT